MNDKSTVRVEQERLIPLSGYFPAEVCRVIDGWDVSSEKDGAKFEVQYELKGSDREGFKTVSVKLVPL